MDRRRFEWIISGLDWEKLDDREIKFIESCEDRMKRKGSLTKPMEDWLEIIYGRKSR